MDFQDSTTIQLKRRAVVEPPVASHPTFTSTAGSGPGVQDGLGASQLPRLGSYCSLVRTVLDEAGRTLPCDCLGGATILPICVASARGPHSRCSPRDQVIRTAPEPRNCNHWSSPSCSVLLIPLRRGGHSPLIDL